MPKIRQTCSTTLVLEALRRANDFMTQHQLCLATQRSANQVSAAVIHLLAKRCVGVVIQGKERHWYALPPEDDARLFTREEYSPHVKPRRRTARNKK